MYWYGGSDCELNKMLVTRNSTLSYGCYRLISLTGSQIQLKFAMAPIANSSMTVKADIQCHLCSK